MAVIAAHDDKAANLNALICFHLHNDVKKLYLQIYN